MFCVSISLSAEANQMGILGISLNPIYSISVAQVSAGCILQVQLMWVSLRLHSSLNHTFCLQLQAVSSGTCLE